VIRALLEQQGLFEKEKEIMLPNSKAGFQGKEIYSMNNLWM
jgi:hypothetical protein